MILKKVGGSIKKSGVRSKKSGVREAIVKKDGGSGGPHMRYLRGVRSIFGGLDIRSLPFFLERGSMTDEPNLPLFCRAFRLFLGPSTFFSDPPPFAERKEPGVPFGDGDWSGAKCRRVRSKSSGVTTK